ncbi:MAG: hypothetical protein ACFFCX_10830 [Candidatus Sifarchaeia archaeon]
MSGNISRKRKQKAMRQRSKEEIKWYTKFFADIIEDRYERTMFPDSEYNTLTSEQIFRLTMGPGIRRISNP